MKTNQKTLGYEKSDGVSNRPRHRCLKTVQENNRTPLLTQMLTLGKGNEANHRLFEGLVENAR